MLLELTDVCSRYGRVPALHGVSLNVAEGEMVALVGANGAGKSTLLRVISGVQPLTEGRVAFAGADLAGVSAAWRVRRGISQVPEGRQVFAAMSVRENLELGAYRQPAARLRGDLDAVLETFPALRERLDGPAGMLSGGQQQMLAIGRALMARPRLLLLDEPSLGLSPLLVEEVFAVIRRLRAEGTAILLVEQNAHLALSVADRGYVLETGRLVLAGGGRELLADPAVQAAYLGQ